MDLIEAFFVCHHLEEAELAGCNRCIYRFRRRNGLPVGNIRPKPVKRTSLQNRVQFAWQWPPGACFQHIGNSIGPAIGSPLNRAQ